MLLRVLDMLECPLCEGASRIWTLEGDFSDTRMADGTVTCPNNHKWQVREDILRFDKEEADEPMIFLDNDRTGYPKEVKESERGSFLAAFAGFCMDFKMAKKKLLKMTGDPVLFFRYIDDLENELAIFHPDEGILRQIQVNTAKMQIYDKASFVRYDNIPVLGDVSELRIFSSANNFTPLSKGDMEIKLAPNPAEESSDILWSGETHSLVLINH